ncbi:minor tail protein [Mycobacterium phage PhrostyMug]|uniref:minor tail protein n=1 Tax=Mycobacterium phage PhrostyMug TaxID=1354512 RepID=UPI0003926F25|nr:minor tail protein [Mycobacterium phage PhrostyMug]AGU92217.1 structural protein [Mycobacterium phage PhrostyMug]QNL30865.1 hypothetical protein SEA_MULE_5 [Mycobacterium phage Mule]
MAGMSLATTAFAKAAIGSTEIQKISIGTTEIWSAAPPPTVDFDAVSSMQGGLADLSYSFSATAGSRVFVVAHLLGNETVAGVTYGGNAMSLVQGIAFNNTSSEGWLRVYTLASAPGGSQTVVLDKNGSNWCMSYAISYANVASLGTPATATGSSTSPSHSVSAPPTNGRTFQVTGWNNGNVTFTPSGGTGRINGVQIAGGLTGRDSNAAATYSGTLSFSCPWASIAVPMTPVT